MVYKSVELPHFRNLKSSPPPPPESSFPKYQKFPSQSLYLEPLVSNYFCNPRVSNHLNDNRAKKWIIRSYNITAFLSITREGNFSMPSTGVHLEIYI